MNSFRIASAVLAAVVMVGCGGGGSGSDGGTTADGGVSRGKQVAGLTGSAASGKTLFGEKCAGCHGTDGKTGKPGGSLVEAFQNDPVETAAGYIIDGIKAKNMPEFGSSLTNQQVADIIAHGKATIK